jgi:hypothetical protein
VAAFEAAGGAFPILHFLDGSNASFAGTLFAAAPQQQQNDCGEWCSPAVIDRLMKKSATSSIWTM